MTISEELAARRLPPPPASRREMLDILAANEYGATPPPVAVTGEVIERQEGAYAGKATELRVRLTLATAEPFSFPLYVALPKTASPCPLFVMLNFRPEVPDRYLPLEEILDGGFGVAMLCYTDVTSDDADMTDGLAGRLCPDPAAPDAIGKLGVWAYAASRALDWLVTLPEVDPARVAVAGHSRLGKTALWCAAQDERFAAACSNDAGAGGDSIYRAKRGETAADLRFRFPFWFCPRFGDWSGREDAMPFDQHFLLSAVAPRLVAICSAEEDVWADPEAELRACAAANEVYARYGMSAIAAPAAHPAPPAEFADGQVGWCLRTGTHFFSRADWAFYMRFLRRKGW